MTSKEVSRFVRCACCTEMIEIGRFDDDPETYLSFWYYGEHDGKYRWRQRLAVAWKVLRRGRGHPDHLVLNPKAVAELRAALGGGEPYISLSAPTTFSTGWQTLRQVTSAPNREAE